MQPKRIISVKKIGYQRTKDIEVDSPNHCYYANGIVVSNSHAVSYALNSYLSAYAKTHFPKAFFTSYLYNAKEKQKPLEEIRELVNDARLHRIKISSSDFRIRNSHFKLVDGIIFFGFTDIKGVGASSISTIEHSIQLIEKQLNKDCKDWNWTEFLLFMSPCLNSTCNKALMAGGTLDYLNIPRTAMLFQYKMFKELSKKETLWTQSQFCKNPISTPITFPDLLKILIDTPAGTKEGSGCSNKNRVVKVKGWYGELLDPPYKLIDSTAWIEGVEKELMGIAITCDSVNKQTNANFNCRSFINKDKHTGPIIISGTLTETREIRTRKGKNPGQRMAFGTLADMTGQIGLVIFPDTYKECGRLLYEENQVLVMGNRGKDSDSMIVDNIWEI